MTSVTSSTSSSSSSAAGGSSAGSTIVSDYQTFLKLMTTQMQNQDPTDPMDSSQYATQLATFSQVEQQVRTNDLLSSLNAQLGGTGIGQYAGWVGMQALADTSAIFDGVTPLTLATDASSGADAAILVVRNSAGTVVDQRAVSVGDSSFDWDGMTSNGKRLGSGEYSFQLQSFSNGKLVSTDDVAVYTPIVEVRQDSGGTPILVTGSGKEIGVGEVQALRSGS